MDAKADSLSNPLVLCYHALSEDWPAALSTTPARFAEHLSLLRRRGYRGVTFSEAVRRPNRRTVAVTFDDAYRSVAELARPLLDEVGWPATVFAPTDFVGRDEPMAWPGIERWVGGPHESELVPLRWDDLRALAETGWEVGSHTCSHPRLPSLHDRELVRELELSRRMCEERLERRCRTVAYPYGAVDGRVERAAGAAGYEAAAALPRRQHRSRPLRVARVGVYHHDDRRRFHLKVSTAGRRLQALLGPPGD